jgi:hypothetical protein
MSEKDHLNIDELINQYLDGELSERQSQELKRLITHDEGVARRIKELEKCKLLVASMPHERAPEQMFENIKASLERRVLLQDYDFKTPHRAGAVHLFARRAAAIAAMVALVAILGGVIYTIVKPRGTVQHVIVNTDWSKAKPVAAPVATPKAKPAEIAKENQNPAPVAKPAPMQMELELGTDQYTAVTSYVYRALILDNGLLGTSKVQQDEQGSTYTIVCSRAKMNSIVDELGTIWDKFKSTKFSLGADMSQWAAVIENVRAEQLMQIMTQRHQQDQVQLASDFASMNRAGGVTPEQDSKAVAQIPPILKPVETSAQRSPVKENPAVENVSMTIVVCKRP